MTVDPGILEQPPSVNDPLTPAGDVMPSDIAGPVPAAAPVWPGCLTLDSVKVALGIDPADTGDDAWLAGCVDAVIAFVERCRAAAGTGAIPDPSACHAGHLLSMRLYGRRNSAQGIATFAELGAVYVSRYDPDIEQQLRIGGFLRPGVG